MSLLIKGMEMPKNKGLFYDCLLSLSFDGSGEMFFNRKSYPIAEIPTPHGRLIDVDKLLSDISKLVHQDCKRGKITFGADVIRLVVNTPTIIEAEE